MSDITSIKLALQDRIREVAEHLLPRGILDGRDWCAGSIRGEPGKSLKVCVSGAKAGLWADFAEGGESGDAIDLWMLTRGLKLTDALNEIRKWLGVEAPSFEKPTKTWRRPDKPQVTAPKSAVLDYLINQRKITRAAMTAYRIAEEGRLMVFPLLLPDGTLVNIKRRSIDREPGRQPKTWAESGCEPILFGWQAIPENAREVVLTEGELDALSMHDLGFPALSVPFGGGVGEKQQWIESDFDRLFQFETIYLALDMDAEGEAAAQEIANRLGRHRCRRVKLPHKDTNACAMAGMTRDDMEKLIEGAESLDPPELRRAGEYSEEVINLFWPKDGVEPGYRLPFSKLQKLVVFRHSEVTIWTGSTGAGKSQLLSHICVGFGDQGARICIASLEMAPRQMLKRMVKQAGNADRPTEAYIRACMSWLNERVWVSTIVGKSQVARLLEIFEYARCKYACDVFVIDSLMRLGVGAEDYEGQEQAMFEIVNWAVSRNVHCHLVAHARKSDRNSSGVAESEDVKGTSEIAANAFNVISVWRNRKLEQELHEAEEALARGDVGAEFALKELTEKPTVIMNVAKQRNGDWEGKSGLWFITKSYQYRGSQDSPHGQTYAHLRPVDEYHTDPLAV